MRRRVFAHGRHRSQGQDPVGDGRARPTAARCAGCAGRRRRCARTRRRRSQLDGDLDSDIVFHEYGHGLTWRMIGGMSGPIAGAIGEGASDVLRVPASTVTTVIGEYSFGDARRHPPRAVHELPAHLQRLSPAARSTTTARSTPPRCAACSQNYLAAGLHGDRRARRLRRRHELHAGDARRSRTCATACCQSAAGSAASA